MGERSAQRRQHEKVVRNKTIQNAVRNPVWPSACDQDQTEQREDCVQKSAVKKHVPPEESCPRNATMPTVTKPGHEAARNVLH